MPEDRTLIFFLAKEEKIRYDCEQMFRSGKE
jgi:hypothetical protein